jgi:dihydrofolate synthase/folylpolyglutamate synthase
MSYATAVEKLYALGHELATHRKWDLEHMRTLAAALGNPERQFPAVLIAGTNGKGSTAAALAGICACAGYRTALYTSPHLVRVNERIQFSGLSGKSPSNMLAAISDDDFARLYFKVDDTAQRLVSEGALPHPPSFFESMTALAFAWFAELSAEIAIVEVGLGGRLDATNIVQPLLSVITDIALDHTEWLGPTITDIAREKAGILRRNGTLVTLPQLPEANHVIGEAAVALNARGVNAAQYVPARIATENAGLDEIFRNRYSISVMGKTIAVDSSLGGVHQQRNLALAMAAAVDLAENHGFKISSADIEHGLHQMQWPGRLELFKTGRAPVLFDVAHNPAGAWALRAALARLPETMPKTLLFSCLADKALAEMTQILFPLFDGPQDRILTAPIENPRAASVEAIVAAAQALDTAVETLPDAQSALTRALEITPPGGMVVVTGSIYLVGRVRELLLPLDKTTAGPSTAPALSKAEGLGMTEKA